VNAINRLIPTSQSGYLDEHELAVYTALKANTWGQKVRLEQERLPWESSLKELIAVLSLTQCSSDR